jgi:hypothetical protein
VVDAADKAKEVTAVLAELAAAAAAAEAEAATAEAAAAAGGKDGAQSLLTRPTRRSQRSDRPRRPRRLPLASSEAAVGTNEGLPASPPQALVAADLADYFAQLETAYPSDDDGGHSVRGSSDGDFDELPMRPGDSLAGHQRAQRSGSGPVLRLSSSSTVDLEVLEDVRAEGVVAERALRSAIEALLASTAAAAAEDDDDDESKPGPMAAGDSDGDGGGGGGNKTQEARGAREAASSLVSFGDLGEGPWVPGEAPEEGQGATLDDALVALRLLQGALRDAGDDLALMSSAAMAAADAAAAAADFPARLSAQLTIRRISGGGGSFDAGMSGSDRGSNGSSGSLSPTLFAATAAAAVLSLTSLASPSAAASGASSHRSSSIPRTPTHEEVSSWGYGLGGAVARVWGVVSSWGLTPQVDVSMTHEC